MSQPRAEQVAPANLDDAELVRRALARDADAFRTIMQRHNQRLYRIARSVLRNNTDAEDAVQGAYVLAFTHLVNPPAWARTARGSPVPMQRLRRCPYSRAALNQPANRRRLMQ